MKAKSATFRATVRSVADEEWSLAKLAGVGIDGDVRTHQPVKACGGGQDLMAVVLDPRAESAA
jgi:hypothetical protein